MGFSPSLKQNTISQNNIRFPEATDIICGNVNYLNNVKHLPLLLKLNICLALNRGVFRIKGEIFE